VSSEGEAPRGRLRRWVPRAALGAGLLLLTTGCKSNAFTRMGMPVPVTSQGKVVLTLWQGGWIAAWCVGIVVWSLILWTVFFHRKRSDRVPQQVRYNLPIEILYTVIPFVMVGVFFYFTARDENYVDSLSHRPNVVVNVIGFQWSWRFQYPQYPVTNPASVCRGTGACEIGETWNGMIGKQSNYNQLPLLEIPDHEWIRFNLISLDVVHSFWVIPFDFKRDVIPDHPNHFEVYTTATYSGIGRCSELCGLYHSRMLFRVKIVTPAQFRTWILAQQAAENAAGGAQ
jgi:cytochrome c oxidase subunit II